MPRRSSYPPAPPAPLAPLAPSEVHDEELRELLGALVGDDWLRIGRPGEWRSATKLDERVDQYEIYSNIGPQTHRAAPDSAPPLPFGSE